MVQIEIFRQESGKITGFAAAGHADQAPHGYDIVCAGVSALTQAALLGLQEHLHHAIDYEQASGKLTVQLQGSPDELTEAVLQTMLLGLQGIAQYSPEHIRIQDRRR